MFLCTYIEVISDGIMLSIMYSARLIKFKHYLRALQYDEGCNLKRIQRNIVKL